jgi:hypothetical protein
VTAGFCAHVRPVEGPEGSGGRAESLPLPLGLHGSSAAVLLLSPRTQNQKSSMVVFKERKGKEGQDPSRAP